jgi:hypothetical protein
MQSHMYHRVGSDDVIRRRSHISKASPLTLTLSPEYRGEGIRTGYSLRIAINGLIALMAVGLTFPDKVRSAETAAVQPPHWQEWSNDVFKTARQEHKFVLLDLGTNWCHWCHVMDEETYANKDVSALIKSKYILVRVDADARPDLSSRYEDYGWPATIVFNADGGEIVKRRGFIPPDEMASMLKAIIADPTPGPSIVATKAVQYTQQTSLSPDVLTQLIARHASTFDSEKGAWGHGQKFLDANSVEWSLRQAPRDPAQLKMATLTLDGELNLVDPAWGGVYQYSTDDDWQHPHFEKIMQMQSQDLRAYALAYAQLHDPKYKDAADAIHGFLTKFLLSPGGAFYTSQDADLIDGVHSAEYFKLSDAQRRAQGIPRIDTHVYSRENGWAIAALASLYEFTGDKSALAQAIRAADWIVQNRSIPGGGFTHDARATAGPYLGDTLAMGQAFLEIYTATGDRAWLKRAQESADFITARFTGNAMPGIMTADVSATSSFAPTQEFDENVMAARWANLLSQYTGRSADKALAQTAMKFLATPQIALSHQVGVAGILLANDELATPALHIAVVGSKSDPDAASLFSAAMAAPTGYKRVEWVDFAEAPLPNADVEYPHIPKAAAFVCTGSACSSPAFTADDLTKKLQRSRN